MFVAAIIEMPVKPRRGGMERGGGQNGRKFDFAPTGLDGCVGRGIYKHGVPAGLGVGNHAVFFIALALHLDGQLWTGDDELKAALRAKGFDRFCEP
jgi:hypothetical protein